LDLLLASSSKSHPHGYLQHLLDEIDDWLDGVERVVFVPWALADWDAYTTLARAAFADLGVEVVGVHESHDPAWHLGSCDAVFVGGGNTFRLLDELQRSGAVPTLKYRVASGELKYMGTSAGTNVACPTISTTNDMPIRWPAWGPGALGLVPFQINAHYLDADARSTHQGETRLERLDEFHEEHDVPVVALREHAWLRVGDRVRVGGSDHGRGPGLLLRRGHDPVELGHGDVLDAHHLAKK
jgi:dipeptidase E